MHVSPVSAFNISERLRLTCPPFCRTDYVLSDAGRRASYDTQRKAQQSSSAGFPPGGFDFFGPDGSDPAKEQWSSASFFNHFFGGAGPSSSSSSSSGSRQHQETEADETEAAHENGQPNASGIFGSVFEELLRPEVQRVAPIWTWVGSASGAGLGFILGSIPGAIAGTVLGNRLGAIRDAKGKSVAAVFAGLGADQKAEVLRALAMKVLGSMAGGSSGRG